MFFSANESKTATTTSAAAVEVDVDMSPRRQWRLTAKGALWFRVVAPGATGTDVAVVGGDGSHYLADGRTFDVAAIGSRTRVSIIRDGATNASGVLSEIPAVQAM
jgi:hypothetical protein